MIKVGVGVDGAAGLGLHDASTSYAVDVQRLRLG